MFRRRALIAVTLTIALAAFAAASAPGLAAQRALRMNEIQVIGTTATSYHRELSKLEVAAHDAIYGGAPVYENFRAYSHASLPNQFRRQRRRRLGWTSSQTPPEGCTQIRCFASGSPPARSPIPSGTDRASRSCTSPPSITTRRAYDWSPA